MPFETMWVEPVMPSGTTRNRSGRRPGPGVTSASGAYEVGDQPVQRSGPAGAGPKHPRVRGSGCLREGATQVLVMLGHAERAADPDSGQIAAVHEPIDGHLGDPHQGGHLGDREEAHLREALLGLGWTRHLVAPILSQARAAATGQALRRGGERACHQNGIDTAVTNALRSVK
jgi:hypothetical protein